MSKWIQWQRSAWLLLGGVLLASCSAIGRQEPKVFDGQFSASGKHYAYIYMSVFVFSYQRTGGRSVSNGVATYYLQLIDTQAGQKLLDKPIKLKFSGCRYPRIGAVNDTHVALLCSNEKGKSTPPMLVSMSATPEVLSSEQLSERNPALAGALNAQNFYRNAAKPDAMVFEGSDGRKYQLDPNTGVATFVTGKFDVKSTISIQQKQGRLPEGLSEQGDGRRYITQGYGDQAPRSQDDFLDPAFLKVVWDEQDDSQSATLIKDGILVLAKTSKDSGQYKQLSLVDIKTLRTRWTIPLPQRKGDWAGRFDEEQFALRDGNLQVANASQLLDINLDNGKIIRDINLVE
jgi:hypothetical protein